LAPRRALGWLLAEWMKMGKPACLAEFQSGRPGMITPHRVREADARTHHRLVGAICFYMVALWLVRI
jgi:hypothetical protein